MGKITIFSGGFGSGKSEIALNYALAKHTHDHQVILADLDFVNPFFVSRDLKDSLLQKGIKLLSPEGDLFFGDVPQIPPHMISYLKQDMNMVLDIAGDEVGALVLGYLSQDVKNRDYEFLLVLNPYRPFARELNDVLNLKNKLEKASRLHFTGIVSNPNLVEETTEEIIAKGHRRVVDYATALDLPLRFLTVEEKFFAAFSPEYKSILKKITLYLRPHWL